jgi:hypothetical protein
VAEVDAALQQLLHRDDLSHGARSLSFVRRTLWGFAALLGCFLVPVD